jgi:hypothetical protein
MAKRLMRLFLIACIASGCDLDERVSRLEKQSKDREAELKQDNPVEVYDLQAKCSKDSKAWFSENWEIGDRRDVTLDLRAEIEDGIQLFIEWQDILRVIAD